MNESARASAEERADEERQKTGVPLGREVVNPVNGERIPIFVADYVLMEYGTGAIMAVPPTTTGTTSSPRPSTCRSAMSSFPPRSTTRPARDPEEAARRRGEGGVGGRGALGG